VLILIAYDGSSDAQAAVDRAGELFEGQDATVLTVWEPFIDVMAHSSPGLGVGGLVANMDEIDAASEQAARERAEEGVARARSAGLKAESRTSPRGWTIAETILLEAERIGAGAVVLGTRGLSRVKSVLLGSVSNGVLQHAERPVLVVPSPEVAGERAAKRG
jgi:nucleotide-binding universal stress UspA family protein